VREKLNELKKASQVIENNPSAKIDEINE